MQKYAKQNFVLVPLFEFAINLEYFMDNTKQKCKSKKFQTLDINNIYVCIC